MVKLEFLESFSLVLVVGKDPEVPPSKSLRGSKVDSAFYLSRSIKWVPEISGNVVVKSKMPPRSGSTALRKLNTIHKKGPQSFFFKILCMASQATFNSFPFKYKNWLLKIIKYSVSLRFSGIGNIWTKIRTPASSK